jgi:hypothetical protein
MDCNGYYKYKNLRVFSYLLTLLEIEVFNIHRRRGYDETLEVYFVPARV